jgi:hypothetical protein
LNNPAPTENLQEYRTVGRNTDNAQNYVPKTLVLVLGRGKEDEG